MFYKRQGAYLKAEPLFERTLNICEKVLGAVHPQFAASLYNLAALYVAQGAHAKAKPLCARALSI